MFTMTAMDSSLRQVVKEQLRQYHRYPNQLLGHGCSRSIHLGDDAARLRGHWLFGLSSQAERVSASARLILT